MSEMVRRKQTIAGIQEKYGPRSHLFGLVRLGRGGVHARSDT